MVLLPPRKDRRVGIVDFTNTRVIISHMSSERGGFNPYGAEVTALSLENANLISSNERQRVTGLIRRSAARVLTGLEKAVVPSFIYTTKRTINKVWTQGETQGESVLSHIYAPTVGAIAAAMSWDEGNNDLALLCTGLYLSLAQESIPYREAHMIEVGDFAPTISSISAERARFITDHDIPQSSIDQVDLLLKLFDMKGPKKTKILAQLKKSSTTRENAFKALRKL